MYEAEDGQCYCGLHRLEHCQICCCDFRGMNAYARDEITDTADVADYGEDTFVDAALALHTDLFGRPLLESRRAAQARVLAELGPRLDSGARNRAVARLAREERRLAITNGGPVTAPASGSALTVAPRGRTGKHCCFCLWPASDLVAAPATAES